MKIYIAHSTKFDFINKLYAPLKSSDIAKRHQFIFPHEDEVGNSKEIIKNADLVLAEVSYPSTAEGVELGWADAFGKQIIAIYKAGHKPTSALNFINLQKREYSTTTDLIAFLDQVIK